MGIFKGVNPVFMLSYLLSRIKGTLTFRYFSYLQETQWLKPSQLEEIRIEMLRALLLHAYNNVPHYHKVFKERNLKPSDIREVEDLAKLPITTKDEMRNNFSSFVAKNFQEYKPYLHSTSGSTGEPFRYYNAKESLSMNRASTWRGWGYAGYKLGDKMAILAGPILIPQISGVAEQRLAPPNTINRFIISHPDDRTLYLSSTNLNEKIMREYAELLAKFKPKLIRGNPSALDFFAYFLRQEGIETIRPNAVLTTAEMLFPTQRKLFEDVFNCEVFDGYGAWDPGVDAYECKEHSGYHITAEKAIMEFLDDNGDAVSPGKTGRIVSTSLYNYAMPFIRYDGQDLGIPLDEDCKCSRGLPLMKQIVGRVVDVLKFDDGTVISGWPLTMIFGRFDIKRYQIVQTSGKSLVIKLVKGKNYHEEDTQRLLELLRSYLSEGIEIEAQFVETIPLTKGGKWRYIISEIRL